MCCFTIDGEVTMCLQLLQGCICLVVVVDHMCADGVHVVEVC